MERASWQRARPWGPAGRCCVEGAGRAAVREHACGGLGPGPGGPRGLRRRCPPSEGPWGALGLYGRGRGSGLEGAEPPQSSEQVTRVAPVPVMPRTWREVGRVPNVQSRWRSRPVGRRLQGTSVTALVATTPAPRALLAPHVLPRHSPPQLTRGLVPLWAPAPPHGLL